jgi:hypothetical protein
MARIGAQAEGWLKLDTLLWAENSLEVTVKSPGTRKYGATNLGRGLPQACCGSLKKGEFTHTHTHIHTSLLFSDQAFLNQGSITISTPGVGLPAQCC